MLKKAGAFKWLLTLAVITALLLAVSGCGGKSGETAKRTSGQQQGAQDDLAFYNGKTVTFIVATKAGGGYDAYARLITPYLQKNLPGSTVIVKNVPGAGHIIGANEIYNSKPDGLTLGTFNKGLIMSQIAGLEGIKFDLAKFTWLADASTESRAFIVGSKTPYKSIDDLKNYGKEIKMASAGVGSASHSDALLLSNIFGFKVKMISGYSGQDADLAMMRGEIDGQVGAYDSMRSLLENKEARALLVIGRNKIKGMEDVPLLSEKAPPDKKAIADLMNTQAWLARPIAAPPGMPGGKARVLREAIKKSLEDPDLLEKAKQAKLPVDYVPGDDVAKLINSAISQPPEIKELVAEIVKSEGKKD